MRLHTRAFAVACAFVSGASVFVLTLFFMAGAGDPRPLSVLAGFLFGYSVSLPGAFIGAMWAYLYGLVLGGILAFSYNIAVVPNAPPPFEWESEARAEEG
ncbi:MAG: hypothetical protein ACE5HF_08020 [Gemmatimonadota bacterium]